MKAPPLPACVFGPFDGRVWLNCAHQGPLPEPAVEAAREALALKIAPSRLHGDLFARVPARLRETLARLMDVAADEIVLGNSASHGLHQLVHGLPWRENDEVLLVRGDFPATTLPWHLLERRNVPVRWIEAPDGRLTADMLEESISASTRVFCTTWVHSFLGHAVDLEALGKICRQRGVWFVVNASQGLGSIPIAPARLGIDALVSCGHKFLCGPYGTGVCWMRPSLRDQLQPTQMYWLAHIDLDRLESPSTSDLAGTAGVRAFDQFATANFMNFMPWIASIDCLLSFGIAAIAEHVQLLIDRLFAAINGWGYNVVSPLHGPSRSALVLLEHERLDMGRAAEMLAEAGIDCAVRQGRIRLSPHLYTTDAEIDRAAAALIAISQAVEGSRGR